MQKNPHDQSFSEPQPCPCLAIIRPHECLSSLLLLLSALTVTHPAMTVTPVQRASRQQGPATSNEAVKGPYLWTVATNTSWSSPIAQQQTPTTVPSHCTHWEKMYWSGPLFSRPAPPSLCQVVVEITSSMLRHKELLKCLTDAQQSDADTTRGQQVTLKESQFHVKFGAKTHMIKTARCYGLKKKCSENHCVQSITTIAINCVWQTNP